MVTDLLPVPEHVAFIMDGNRRWADKNGLPSIKGHEEGKKRIEDVLEGVLDLGIKYATFWALSLDNMQKRSKEELKNLMDLFENSFKELAEDDRIHENEVRVKVIGRWRERLPENVKSAIKRVVEETKNYSKYFLNILVSYSGKDEMLKAIEKIVEEDRNGGVDEVTPDLLKEKLMTSDLPPVDLMVRTGGEPHNSAGFMMWDVSDSQFYFTEKYWPEFGEEELKKAVQDYRNRERRFGE
ncbi:MAG: polyprenyl diphosphate synthase [Candidatus Aenigmatarchaeota archaeon]